MSLPLTITRNPFLICAAVIEAVEGLASIAFGVVAGADAIFGKPHNRASAVALAIIMVATGIVMFAVARGLLLKLSWSRSPAVLTQLFALFIGYNLIESRQQGYGIPMIACAVVALVAIFAPSPISSDRPDSQAFDSQEEDG